MKSHFVGSRSITPAISCLVVGVIVLGVAACSGAGHTARPGQPRPAIHLASMMAAENRAVNTATDGGAMIAASGAFTMSNPATAGSLPMRTDRGGDLGAGSYTLTVYCAGKGHIIAMLSVGKAAVSLTAACPKVPEPMRLHLRARRAGELAVVLSVRQRELVAVAYRLTGTPPP
jgi:hypothetical protein